jgi:hypothetical protein
MYIRSMPASGRASKNRSLREYARTRASLHSTRKTWARPERRTPADCARTVVEPSFCSEASRMSDRICRATARGGIMRGART